MLPKDTPYPFDNMPNENYFGEFRELSNSIGQFEKNDKEKNDHRNRRYGLKRRHVRVLHSLTAVIFVRGVLTLPHVKMKHYYFARFYLILTA